MDFDNSVNILNVKILKIDYSTLVDKIKSALHTQKRLTISGANTNFINIASKDKQSAKIFSKIDLLHPDGIGIFWASKFLYGKKGFNERFTGSDFYQILINTAIQEQWSFYFFGDEDATLEKILAHQSDLSVIGKHNGYVYADDNVIGRINNSKPDILIVGLGSPKQEEWIIKNQTELDVNIIIAVGDGIKVFAGTKKRGPKFVQKIGLEWLIRLFFEPKRLWRRYLIGNPLFILQILKVKFLKKLNINDNAQFNSWLA